MPDFSKTIIYKIVHKTNPDDYDVYVGHTTNFKQRKWEHNSYCNNPNSKKYNRKVYQYIRQNGGLDNFQILEIEKYPCNSFNEACEKEQEWYYKLNSNLNMLIPNRKQKQYYQDNYDKIADYRKQYFNNNREKISEINKQYRINNLDKILEYDRNRPNKQERNEKQKEKITCDNCGSIVRKGDIARHKKSQKCINAKK